MNIAFDAHPLICDRMTGIGYCEAGLVKALTKAHPKDTFLMQYFSLRSPQTKIERLKPYTTDNCTPHAGFFSGLVYRAASTLVPIPYKMFFGKKADITHFFNYIVPAGVSGKRIVTVHDMVYKAFPETMNARTKKLLDMSLVPSMNRADVIVTDSEFSKKEIIKYHPQFEEKLRVVPCGVDLNRFSPETDSEKIENVRSKYDINAEYFLYLGTIEPRKNLERLIEAYNIFRTEHGTDNIPKLVLAGGKGWLFESIFEKVTELGLSENVVFTKYVDESDLRALMSGALAFVFPSIYEGFGMPPLEAMACGTPCVVSTEASLPEVTGSCGVNVDAYSPRSIAEGLHKISSDKYLRDELSQKSYERAITFTWQSAAKTLYKIYEEAAGK